jgi:putative SOS response-associated peptidase YedK
MCGRYASFLPAEFIARLFATVNPLPNLAPTRNIAPTMDAPVVRLIDGDRHLDALKWGLVPYFTKDLKKARKPINARSETIATSGMFKAASRSAVALCPPPHTTSGATTRMARRRSPWPASMGSQLSSAGSIWERWKSPDGELLQTFAAITTDANRQLAGIRDRMPVIIERKDWPLWLGEAEGDPASLLRPAPEDVLRIWPVGKAVGKVKNDGSVRPASSCSVSIRVGNAFTGSG